MSTGEGRTAKQLVQQNAGKVGAAGTLEIGVYNEGDAPAENCRINWYYRPAAGDIVAPSPSFGLPPDTDFTATLTTQIPFGEPGEYETPVLVQCANAEVETTAEVPVVTEFP